MGNLSRSAKLSPYIAALALSASLDERRTTLRGQESRTILQNTPAYQSFLDRKGDVGLPTGMARYTGELANACLTGNKSGSGWRPAEKQHSSGERNICVKGKLVPEVYVLGAPKCATTTFAFEFAGAGAECAAGTKEYHFWKEEAIAEYYTDSNSSEAKWLQPLPSCDKGTRRIVADFTPEYLATLPHPQSDQMPLNRNTTLDDALSKHSLPMILNSIYGVLGSKVKFFVMLREPLARMHSWWYYCGKKEGFQDHAAEEVTVLKGSAWHSTYGWQLKVWTEIFDFKQFYVIPFKLFGGNSSEHICRDVQQRVHFDMQCNPVGPERLHSSHPSLEKDTSAAFRTKFNDFMAGDKAILVDTLTAGSVKGMGLPSFTGKVGSHRDLQHWLEYNW